TTMMLAYAVGRIGCQVSGDGDWGIVNNNPNPFSWLPDWVWSYKYPHNVNEMGIKIPGCEGKFCNELPEAVYPTPLYEIVECVILFFILWSLRKRLKVPGTLFALYLMFNGIERFFIEKIRVNTRINIFGFQPTQAEVISSLLFLSGLTIWIILSQRAKKTPAVKS
ncbi:MAG: prolipoprotein diacylglyceryl transferase, partial [Chitinophagaceae bacterium]|nr:prolipoprotein diacylglyceryl transferase [Chitinophagaceae bacterium]